MSDSAKPDSRPSSRVINAFVGAAVLLAILLLVNYVFNQVSFRFDLTENNIYTLTDGTKSVIDKLEEAGNPVTIRFYAVTADDYVSQFYLSRASSVEDFLKEYENQAGGLITVKRYNPEPFSDDAESAKFDGLPRGVFDDPENPVYFGLAIESEGRKEVLPFLPARREELLEYDITRALLRVSDPERQKVTIMTSMEVNGGFGGNFGAPPKQPWYLMQSLQGDYNVEVIDSSTPEIPADTDVLVVLHPYDMGDEGQFAIDQYLLKGGRVLASVDPMFFAARYMAQGGGNPMMGQQPPSGPEPMSDLNKLFAAWGVRYDSNLVLADMASQTRIANGYSPTVLSIPEKAMNSTDPVTAQLSDLFLITPGGFELEEKPGLTTTVLVSSSDQSAMVNTSQADPTQKDAVDMIRKNFNPDGKHRVLAARISGTFETAFPQGLGGAEEAAADPAAAAVPAAPAATEPVVPADDETDEADAPEKVETPKAETEKPAPDADKSEKADKPEAGDAAKPEADAPESTKPETGGPEEDEAAAEVAEAAAEAAPVASGALKTSEKEGVVVVIADSDFVYDSFAVQQVQNMENGRVEMQPVNSNLALFENLLEQLAGGDELIRVRSRASNHRPFTRLNSILEKVEAEFRPELDKITSEINSIETERQAIGQNILSSLMQNPDQKGQQEVSEEIGAQVVKLQEQEEQMAVQMRELQRKQYEVNKKIKQEFDSAKNGIILLVTAVLPLLLILFGIGLAISQRLRTAAQ